MRGIDIFAFHNTIRRRSYVIIGFVAPAIGPNKSKKLTRLISPTHNIRGKVWMKNNIHGFTDNAPFQITVLGWFSSVWFSLVTVLLIVCPRSLLLCPFHKKLRIWWKKSFGFCQTDNPRSSFMMYCYSTDLNVYTWVERTYQNRQVFWIQFLT